MVRYGAMTFVTASALWAAAANAADFLPLRQGIYVAANVACDGHFHAVTMSYWGNEINSQRSVGAIQRVELDGDRYLVTIEFSEGGSDPEVLDVVLRIPDGQTFVFEEPAPATTYRWCFERMP